MLPSYQTLALKARVLLERTFTYRAPAGSFVGVDIGSRMLKLVELRYCPPRWELVRFRCVPVGVDANGDAGGDRQHIVGETLAHVVHHEGLQGVQVAVAVSGPSVIVKSIVLPRMTTKEARCHVEWELDTYLPYARDDIYWDVHIPDGPRASNDEIRTIYLVAAKKDVVDARVSLVRQAGLVPAAIDVESFALLNMYRMNYGDDAPKPLALVNIGPSRMTMVSVGANESFAFREVAFTEECSAVAPLPTDTPNAEALYGSSGSFADPLGGVRAEVFHELQRTIQGMPSSFGHQPVERVLLCGGHAGFPQLVEDLRRECHVPVDVVDPLRAFTRSKTTHDVSPGQSYDANASMLAGVSVGLAVRGAVLR